MEAGDEMSSYPLALDYEAERPELVVIVPGRPATGSFRFARGRTFTPANVADWKAAVRLMVQQAVETMIAKGYPVEVTILVRRPRPKSPKKPTKDKPCPWAWTTRPDCDNVTKPLKDALKTVAFADDNQVTDLIVRKRWGEREEVEIRVRQMTEAEHVA